MRCNRTIEFIVLLGDGLQTQSTQLFSYLADFMKMSQLREPKTVESQAIKIIEEWIGKTGEARESSEIVL